MCDKNCIDFGIDNLTDLEIRGKKVLEVGSYDVNGSLRHGVVLHGPREYIGVDISEGPGVDVVCNSDDILSRFGEKSFDIVLSCCALEHISNWKLAVSNMKRVCADGGIIIIIAPSEWPAHDYPSDHWRYSIEDVLHIFSDLEMLKIEEKVSYHGAPIGKLVYAKMRKAESFKEIDLSDFKIFHMYSGRRA